MANTQTMSNARRTYRPGFIARLLPSGGWRLTLADVPTARVHEASGGGFDLHALDVASVTIAKGMLWSRVEVHSSRGVDRLPGLSARQAKALAQDLLGFVNSHLCEIIAADAGGLKDFNSKIGAVVAGKLRYLAEADLGMAMAGLAEATRSALSHPLFRPGAMPVEMKDMLAGSLAMLADPTTREDYNEGFVPAELLRFGAFFDDLDGRSLSDQQREACVRLEDNNLLVASAGSGKSTTMVGKVAYVLEKQLYEASEILVLAFNKSAADELKARLAKQLAVPEAELRCRVTTFHALGRAIIQEVEGRPPQLANWVEHPAGEANAIEEIVGDLVRSDPEFARWWIDLLVLHPKADDVTEIFDSEADIRRYRENLAEKGRATIGSLPGTYVRSLQEQRIANWLWLHSVEFEYERQIEVADTDGTIRHVHPDFYYPGTGTVHEHFAIDADGTSPYAGYVEHSASKREAYGRAQIDFFETNSGQASSETLVPFLEGELVRRGITLRRRDYAEITKVLQPVVIKHYHQLVATCIKHIRARRLTLDMLLERAEGLQDKKRARIYARAVWAITEGYSRKLDGAGRIDFDSMIADAVTLVEGGRYESPFSLILVDEFQDISEPRANLVKALKWQNPFAKLFAVGDDWQSINRFAGSDISLFTRFETNFGTGWEGRLELTYRCNQLIAGAAADFVQRNPDQLRKVVRSTRPAIAKSIRVIPVDGPKGRPDFGEACHRLLGRLDIFLGNVGTDRRPEGGAKLKVMVLWRYNLLDPFRGKPPIFRNIDVSGLSFHKSKGLEADYTVLMDISEGDYGVPSGIEDDELLGLVIPSPEKFPNAEERRLFYVALTRAARGVFMLVNQRKPSPFIRELCEVAGDDIRFETVDGKALDQCPSCLVGQLVERRSKDGKTFTGCNQFPDCKHTSSAVRK